ncbi:SitI3 family protein [Archangium sp.]|uniref:SitI3 family protein n=1 Tax=Archangium sp. TaxID=1872627 RepID=UPI00286B95F3|nr:SitI3 family protein [Archangium sp.]
MALEYALYLKTHLEPERALSILANRVAGVSWSDDGSFLIDTTVTMTVTEPLARTRSLLEEVFHFIPTLRLGFRFVNNTDHDRARHLMLQATLLMLEHAQDALLLFNGEIIVLQRFGGELVFNSEHETWDDRWLRSRLAHPFEWRPLPSPLL